MNGAGCRSHHQQRIKNSQNDQHHVERQDQRDIRHQRQPPTSGVHDGDVFLHNIFGVQDDDGEPQRADQHGAGPQSVQRQQLSAIAAAASHHNNREQQQWRQRSAGTSPLPGLPEQRDHRN